MHQVKDNDVSLLCQILEALTKLLSLDRELPDEFNDETALKTMMEECNGFETVESKYEHPNETVKEMVCDFLERFATHDAEMVGAQ